MSQSNTNETELVQNIVRAAHELADAIMAETALEDSRINVKLAAVERIMARGDNQLTGKPHSFSSAENIVNTDEDYQSYLERMRQAAHARIIARGAYDAAVAAARLAAENVSHNASV